MDKSNNKANIIARSFLTYLKNNKEEYLLEKVVEILSKNVEGEKVSVISPKVLSNEEKDRAVKLVAGLVGDKKVNINFTIDESIIDGLKIEYKDKLWDFSLAKQISSIFES